MTRRAWRGVRVSATAIHSGSATIATAVHTQAE